MQRWLLSMLTVIMPLMLGCVAAAPPLTVIPPDKPKAAQAQDLMECQALATQAAQGAGGWTSVAPAHQAMFEQARDEWLLQCMRSRGYVIERR